MAARKKGNTNIKDRVGDPERPQRPVFEVPEGFDDIPSFLSAMRKDFYDDSSFDRLNRDAGLEDLKFAVGDQWDPMVRARREAALKPTLTVNRLPAFIAQVIGARLMNETVIKVLPDTNGTEPIARIREGLIRQIQKDSRAEDVYGDAFKNSVVAGIGNFQIEMDYESDEVFDQVLKLSAIPNAFAVVWDRMMTDPTGRDAGHGFVVDVMRKASFNKRWPWATASDLQVDYNLRSDITANGWISVDDVRIVSYWRLLSRKRALALLNNGDISDITDKIDPESDAYDKAEAEKLLSSVMQRPDGAPIMREVDVRYAQMYLCSGLDILEGPYELPISRLPIFRVPGWEMQVDEWKHRWGLVRFMKDPQRLHNYWRSVLAEKIMQTPRAVWTAAQEAVAGREDEWRNSHRSDDPLLVWNGESGKEPKRVEPAKMESALITEAEMTSQDLKDVSNIHEANLGMPSNEVSGAAIVARQRVSDTGTIMYQQNLTRAIEEAGQVLNQLISVCYDTPRIVKILGADGAEDLQIINTPSDPRSANIADGKYSITVKTGPSTATKRVEATASMMAFINAAPQVAAYTLDLVAEAMDWPQHEEFARRIRMTLPPGMVNPKDLTPEEQKQYLASQDSSAQQNALANRDALAKITATESQATLNNARATKEMTVAQLAPAETATKQVEVSSKAADRETQNHFEAIRIADGK